MFLNTPSGYSQDVIIKVGTRDSIQSRIMGETRKLMVSLPADYEKSNKKYPVLFVLDGSENSLINARLITSRLDVESIIVAVRNTDRDRDMMPLSAPSYVVKQPAAENFLSFIEKELIPYIDNKYRSDGQRTIWGASLSGVFVMYTFLSKPELFSNYLGNCAGWYSDMSTYFNSLADRSFQTKERYKGKKLFVANSTTDPYDPKREIHKEMLDFSDKMRTVFGNSVYFKYATYENAAHVPYSGFYDGMKYFMA